MNANATITELVNMKFDSIAPGFPEVESTPAMTTPTTITLCEVVVTGSTLCLVC